MTVTYPTHLTGMEREGIATILEAVERFGTDLQAYRQLGNIRVQLSPGGGLLIFNYTDAAQIDASWTPVEQVSRGLIIDWRDVTIRALPWSKFFNLNERPETQFQNLPRGAYEVTDKLDGSMGIGYYDEYGYFRIATRGSFTSEQAEWATDWWHNRFDRTGLHFFGSIIAPEVTPIFEIIYPENRIVVEYPPEMTGLHLIGVRELNGREFTRREVEELGRFLDLPVVQSFQGYYLEDIMAMLPQLRGVEGFVVRFKDSNLRVKFKTDEYRELHWLLSELTYNKLLAIAHKRGEEELNRYVDEILIRHADKQMVLDLATQYRQALIEATDSRERHLRSLYAALTDNGRLVRELSRKELALRFREVCDNDEIGFMFCMADGDDIRPRIIKQFWLNRSKVEL